MADLKGKTDLRELKTAVNAKAAKTPTNGGAEEVQVATEIPGDILSEANKLLDEGSGFEYAYQVWQRRHHGDENLGKGLFLSIGAQSCISSKGVHVHACGPRGSGKSDGAEKASEAIPS